MHKNYKTLQRVRKTSNASRSAMLMLSGSTPLKEYKVQRIN